METELKFSSGIIPDEIKRSVYKEVASSLESITTVEDNFIVNPTVYRSVSNLNPRVTNSAKFLSGNFQDNLRDDHGWTKEKRIIEQTIDAYKEYEIDRNGYFLDEEGFRKMHFEYWKNNKGLESIPEFTRDVKNFYVDRRHPEIVEELDRYREYFKSGSNEDPIIYKVGLEFETGNIASSFRALTKLTVLYREGEIDVGVFVATSREAATTIWPPTNRNGSFEELENRHYRSAIVYPVMEVKFEPDGYSEDAPFLDRSGDLYEIESTGEVVREEGKEYEKCKGGSSTYLKES